MRESFGLGRFEARLILLEGIRPAERMGPLECPALTQGRPWGRFRVRA